MVEIGKEYNINEGAEHGYIYEMERYCRSLIKEAIKQNIPFIKIICNPSLLESFYISNYYISQNDIFLYGRRPSNVKERLCIGLRSITTLIFLETHNDQFFKTDLITDLGKFDAILRAMVYNYDRAEIKYLENDKIIDITFEGISLATPKPHSYRFGDHNLAAYSSKIYNNYFQNKHTVNPYDCDNILSIKVYNENRKSDMLDAIHIFTENKLSREDLKRQFSENQLYSDSANIEKFNKIYNETKPSKIPIYSEKELYIYFEKKINWFLAEKTLPIHQFITVYRFLLFFLNELEKYNLPSNKILKLQLLFLDKVTNLYLKFQEFDKFKYFENEIKKTNPTLFEAYHKLGKNYIIGCNFSITKINLVLKKNKETENEYKRFTTPVLLDIYKKFELEEKKLLSIQETIKQIDAILKNHSVDIKTNIETIRDYFDISVDEPKRTLRLDKRKY